MALQIASATKLSSLCRTLLPCIHHGQDFFFSGGENDVSGSSSRSSCGSEVARTRRPVMVRATSSQRWTLDDVERISKGKASKAKTGSRKVPHRLQAGERTCLRKDDALGGPKHQYRDSHFAYDLAKKKGYLVQRAVSRKYPLVNTYRNFCDASCRLCIFIQQGTIGSDLVVIDLTPLRLSGDGLVQIREQVAEVVQLTLQSFSVEAQPQIDGYNSSVEEYKEDGERDDVSSSHENEEEEDKANEESMSILRIGTGRSEAKVVCQAVWDFWQAYTKMGKIRPVVEEGRMG